MQPTPGGQSTPLAGNRVLVELAEAAQELLRLIRPAELGAQLAIRGQCVLEARRRVGLRAPASLLLR